MSERINLAEIEALIIPRKTGPVNWDVAKLLALVAWAREARTKLLAFVPAWESFTQGVSHEDETYYVMIDRSVVRALRSLLSRLENTQ